jgi:energy-converting hydrogenase Eha subunit B
MAPVKRPSAQAGQLAPAQNGTADVNIAPAVPKYNQVVPASSASNGAAFGGSQQQIDFNLPNSIGKGIKYTLQFDVKFTAAANATAASCFLASSASLIDHVDFLYAGNVVESIFANTMLYESIVFNSDNEQAQHSAPWAIDIATTNQVKPLEFNVPAGATGTKGTLSKTLFLPLSGVLPSSQMFIAGCTGQWTIRVVLAANALCAANGFASTSGATINLTNLYLWVEEASMSEEAFGAMVDQHQSGVNYRSVIRSVFQTAAGNLSDTTPTQQVLTSLKNDSAALLIWVGRAQTADPGYFLTRDPLTYVQLLNASGSTLTRQLPVGLLENEIATSTVPLGSNFVNSANFTTYIVPWCSSLERVIHAGRVLGGIHLDNTQLVIQPAASSSDRYIYVVSYDYCSLRVEGGNVTWSKTAGDL